MLPFKIDAGKNTRTINVVLIVEAQKIKKRVEWGPHDFISVFKKVVETINRCTKQLCNRLIIYLRQAQVRTRPTR